MTDASPDHTLPPHAASFAPEAGTGKLRLQRCAGCATVPEFPRIACPGCFGELEWFDATGRGRVFTFGVVRRPHHARFEPELPIVIAVVELDEGVRLISAIVGESRLETEIGSPVALAVEGVFAPLPQFRLVEEPAVSRIPDAAPRDEK